MPVYAALLRAVNVGGAGKLPMAELARICREAGFEDVRTYIASGNVVFRGPGPEADMRAALETGLAAHAGKPVGVVVRTGAEMADVAARNPFPHEPGDRVAVVFCDALPPGGPLEGARGLQDEQVRAGKREVYVFYPGGMGRSRLRLPFQDFGTARNMNTVAALARMAAAPGDRRG